MMLKRIRRSHEAESNTPHGASRGQVLVMFALFASAMFAVLGLAIDLGYTFTEKRTVQNAADLAAIAGARAVARYVEPTGDNPGNEIAAEPDVQAVIDGNQLNSSDQELESCLYVDRLMVTDYGECNDTVPASAVGVTVTVSATHDTLFLRIFPWAPARLTNVVTSTAWVARTQFAGVESPLMICGYHTKLDADPTQEFSILQENGSVDPEAIGKTYRIFDNSNPTGYPNKDAVGFNNIARCGAPETGAWLRWRGGALSTTNGPAKREIEQHWNVQVVATNGNPLSITKEVLGVEGCIATVLSPVTSPFNCIMLVPVVCDTAHGCASTGTSATTASLYVAKVLAFRIQACGSGAARCLSATLLDDYLNAQLSYPGGGDWTRDAGAVVGIRLRED